MGGSGTVKWKDRQSTGRPGAKCQVEVEDGYVRMSPHCRGERKM
jgi:hypothetical protein